MAADSPDKLTVLAAEILRDAVRIFDQGDMERWLVGYNPVLAGWNATGSFQAVTGAFAAVGGAAADRSRDARSAQGETGRFRAVTSSFKAITSSFAAIGRGDNLEPAVSLRKVFRLPGKLPGVRLPPEPELAAFARAAPVMRGLDAFARWLGVQGRVVTEAEELSDEDAADACRRIGVEPGQLTFLWEYALTSGWFDLIDEPSGKQVWVMIGQTAWRWNDGGDADVLHAWAAVLSAVLTRALDVPVSGNPAAARRLRFEGQGVALAVLLFLARKSGLTLEEADDLVREGAIGERPSARARWAWDAWVRAHGEPSRMLLSELTALGAVTVPRTLDGAVELTPPAVWALREQFKLDGIAVPLLAAASPSMSAAELVAMSDAVSERELTAAFTTWARGRSPDRAARELLMFAGSSSAPNRLAAVKLTRRIGLPAYRAWRDAIQRPQLRGYARITLSMFASHLPESTLPLVLNPDPDDLTWVATDLLAMACGADDPNPDDIQAQFAEAVPPGEEAWIFRLMSSSSHPDVARLLDVLGYYHPDRQVCREARKAARAAAKNRRSRGADRVPARAAGR